MSVMSRLCCLYLFLFPVLKTMGLSVECEFQKGLVLAKGDWSLMPGEDGRLGEIRARSEAAEKIYKALQRSMGRFVQSFVFFIDVLRSRYTEIYPDSVFSTTFVARLSSVCAWPKDVRKKCAVEGVLLPNSVPLDILGQGVFPLSLGSDVVQLHPHFVISDVSASPPKYTWGYDSKKGVFQGSSESFDRKNKIFLACIPS